MFSLNLLKMWSLPLIYACSVRCAVYSATVYDLWWWSARICLSLLHDKPVKYEWNRQATQRMTGIGGRQRGRWRRMKRKYGLKIRCLHALRHIVNALVLKILILVSDAMRCDAMIWCHVQRAPSVCDIWYVKDILFAKPPISFMMKYTYLMHK